MPRRPSHAKGAASSRAIIGHGRLVPATAMAAGVRVRVWEGNEKSEHVERRETR